MTYFALGQWVTSLCEGCKFSPLTESSSTAAEMSLLSETQDAIPGVEALPREQEDNWESGPPQELATALEEMMTLGRSLPHVFTTLQLVVNKMCNLEGQLKHIEKHDSTELHGAIQVPAKINASTLKVLTSEAEIQTDALEEKIPNTVPVLPVTMSMPETATLINPEVTTVTHSAERSQKEGEPTSSRPGTAPSVTLDSGTDDEEEEDDDDDEELVREDKDGVLQVSIPPRSVKKKKSKKDKELPVARRGSISGPVRSPKLSEVGRKRSASSSNLHPKSQGSTSPSKDSGLFEEMLSSGKKKSQSTDGDSASREKKLLKRSSRTKSQKLSAKDARKDDGSDSTPKKRVPKKLKSKKTPTKETAKRSRDVPEGVTALDNDDAEFEISDESQDSDGSESSGSSDSETDALIDPAQVAKNNERLIALESAFAELQDRLAESSLTLDRLNDETSANMGSTTLVKETLDLVMAKLGYSEKHLRTASKMDEILEEAEKKEADKEKEAPKAPTVKREKSFSQSLSGSGLLDTRRNVAADQTAELYRSLAAVRGDLSSVERNLHAQLEDRSEQLAKALSSITGVTLMLGGSKKTAISGIPGQPDMQPPPIDYSKWPVYLLAHQQIVASENKIMKELTRLSEKIRKVQDTSSVDLEREISRLTEKVENLVENLDEKATRHSVREKVDIEVFEMEINDIRLAISNASNVATTAMARVRAEKLPVISGGGNKNVAASLVDQSMVVDAVYEAIDTIDFEKHPHIRQIADRMQDVSCALMMKANVSDIQKLASAVSVNHRSLERQLAENPEQLQDIRDKLGVVKQLVSYKADKVAVEQVLSSKLDISEAQVELERNRRIMEDELEQLQQQLQNELEGIGEHDIAQRIHIQDGKFLLRYSPCIACGAAPFRSTVAPHINRSNTAERRPSGRPASSTRKRCIPSGENTTVNLSQLMGMDNKIYVGETPSEEADAIYKQLFSRSPPPKPAKNESGSGFLPDVRAHDGLKNSQRPLPNKKITPFKFDKNSYVGS